MDTGLDQYQFVEPTKKLRQYLMLDAIYEENRISQRSLSKKAGVSTSVAHEYLNEFQESNLIHTEQINRRDVRYTLTDKGKLKRREYMVAYIRETLQLFSSGKKELGNVLNDYQTNHELQNVLFYSAGEVTELLIHSLEYTDLNLQAVIDDDPEKQETDLFGYPIISPDRIDQYAVDAIIITTFQYRDQIRNRLEQHGVDEKRILEF